MSKYEFEKEGIYRNSRNGKELLCNFTARITKQERRHNAGTTDTVLTIDGQMDGKKLQTITVPAKEFGSLSWITQWGMEPVVFPLPAVEKELKAAIQIESKPKTTDVFTHTGWNGNEFLFNGGSITDKGINQARNVQLPPELTRYKFEPTKLDGKKTFRDSLNLHRMITPDIGWPMILAAYRAPIGKTDYAIHLAGRSGTFKSEATALIQCHFGRGMDARTLPGSWSSTANALEALAYRAKDCIFVIDDFVPSGTAWQVRALQKAADQLIRGQGNQAGRARLTDVSSLQQTMYPRGIILSTGEDIPEGQSLRARTLILEVEPDEISTEKLTDAQNRRDSYPEAMARWINWLAKTPEIRKEHKRKAQEKRNSLTKMGHARTVPMIADMLLTAETLLHYGIEQKYLTTDEAKRLIDSAEQSLIAIGETQERYLITTDPTNAFVDAIRIILGSNAGNVRTRQGTRPNLEIPVGWQQVQRNGETTWKPHGPTIGWIDWEKDEMLIDKNAIPTIKRFSSGRIAMTEQTLIKRVKDAGMLARTDASRKRNTVRSKCDGATREVLAMPLRLLTGEDE